MNDDNSQCKIVVIIPTFNEERFIGSIVIMARNYADTVIVVDDGSTDNTAEVARSAGAVLVAHNQNMGKGMALNTGFLKAAEFEPTIVVTMDADGQHLPCEIPLVIDPILKNQADIVVGSRYLDYKNNVPTHRVLGHALINMITNFLSGVTITDSQSGFRAFSALVFKNISFQSHGFSVESEMQFIAQGQHLRMIDVPILIQYKDKPKRSVILQGMAVLNGVLRLAGQYRPLLFISLPGLFLLLVGLIWGLWVVKIYETVHILAVGYALVSSLLVILGCLTCFVGIILHSVRGLVISLIQGKGGK